MSHLTTHVLDTSAGLPAAGVFLQLHRSDGDGARVLLVQARTNGDGRTDQPLLAGAAFMLGDYQLSFHIGDYFARTGAQTGPRFLDVVPICFAIHDVHRNYHVPLLATPWGYSTYRGS